jgi:histidine ammonia-lyase
MATFAARRLGEMADNTTGIVAIELLAASQGIEFHGPLETSARLAEVKSLVRAVAPPYDRDRPFAPDIAAVKRLIAEGAFARCFPSETLPSLAE